MPENEPGSETPDNDKQNPIKRSEMVSFLISTGKIKEGLAGNLFDSGLDDWKKLVEGDEKYFTSFKGVGKKTAENLMAMAEIKRKEMESLNEVPDLKEVLASVPRISRTVIDSLYGNGYDAYSKFADIEAKDLQKLKGVGPKLSESILEAVRTAVEKYDIPFESIEEATAEMMKEEASTEEGESSERPGSLMDRIINAIKGFFTGKKDQTPEGKEPETPVEKEEKEPEVVEPEPEMSEEEENHEPEEVVEEPPEEKKEETVDQEPEEPVEGDAEKPQEPIQETSEGESEPEEEKPVEEPTPEVEGDEKEPGEPVKDEAGFFQRIKEMFFGKKLEPTGEEPTVSEEEPEGAEGETKEEMVLDEEEAPQESEEEPEPNPEEGPQDLKGEIKEFEDIPRVSKKTAELLRNSGYLSLDELREAVPEDLVMIDGIGLKTAQKICDALKE
jgi:Holliday junction resolvasome RuvABC DNA-binding subunit